MPRSNPLTAAFSSGEFSPRLAARTDFAKYPSGLETCVNLIPLAEGGVMRRPGSRYIAEAKDSAAKTYIGKFIFNTVQAYTLEFGNNYIRFYKNQGQIVTLDTDMAVTNGTFDSGITDWDDRSTGNGAISHDATNSRLSLDGGAAATKAWAEQDISGTANVELILKFQVVGTANDTVKLNLGTTTTGTEIKDSLAFEPGYHSRRFTPTASPFYLQFHHSLVNKSITIDNVSLIDNGAVEIGTPWATADIPGLSFSQTADVMYISHESYPTHRLIRDDDSSWRLEEVLWEDGPYLTQNTTATTLNPSATTGLGVTLAASSTTGINGGDGFVSTDVGRLVRLLHAADWGYGIITSVTNTTNVVIDVLRDFSASTAVATWRLGAWSGTTGYPRANSFFEERFVLAGTTDQPQTFWATQTADIENMRPDSFVSSAVVVEDDDALDYTLAADEVNAILWLTGSTRLVIGTLGGEWIATSSGASLTPSDITVRRRTSHGSKIDVEPVSVGDSILLTQRAGRKVREFVEAEFDVFRAPDMTRLAQHVTIGGIDKMAYQEEPDSLVWAVRGDGQLLSMTFRREEDVVGWARHIIGGSFSTGNAVVESVTVIPGTNGAGQTQDSTDRDEVWIVVKRTINGATKRYIEVLERDFEDGDDQEDAYYADSLLTYDGVSTTVITDLDHVEGETVKIWSDGYIQADKTVVSGAITLDTAATVVQVGLGYTHTLKTLKFEGGTVAGTAQGKTKQIFGVTFVVLNSHTLSFGPDASNLKTIDFRQATDAMDTAVPLYTGERFEEFDGNWEADARMVIQSDDPAPFTLLALAPEIAINESRG